MAALFHAVLQVMSFYCRGFSEFGVLRYLIGSERYIGRVVLVGSSLQGLTAHIVPAILQNLEHLPALFLDATIMQNVKVWNVLSCFDKFFSEKYFVEFL